MTYFFIVISKMLLFCVQLVCLVSLQIFPSAIPFSGCRVYSLFPSVVLHRACYIFILDVVSVAYNLLEFYVLVHQVIC